MSENNFNEESTLKSIVNRHVLPVDDMRKVHSLFLINNEIIGISRNALAGQESSLQYLYIDEAMLQKLPSDIFDNLQVVQKIILEESMISEIPNLSHLTQLKELKVFRSKLKEISMKSHKVMENLHKIQISNSPVKILPEDLFEVFNYLEEVDLSSNELSWAHPRTFGRLERVRSLKLSDNNFKDASTAVMAAREIRSLESIDLSKNKINHLRKGSFVDMQRLERIILSGNGISQIDQEAFYRLPSLKRLDLSNNKLLFFDPDVFTGVQALEDLNLSHNLLTYVVDVKFISIALPNLRAFDVSSNDLTEENVFMFGGHPKLEFLNMSGNKIRTLPKGFLRDLPSLRSANLSYNQITVDHLDSIWDLPRLTSLDLSNNNLTKLHSNLMEGLPNLEAFDASRNAITDVGSETFEPTTRIWYLNISLNQIPTIHQQTLSFLNNLRILDISSNAMTTIDGSLLVGATSLQALHACCNQISTVHKNAFKDTIELNSLDLSKNLFKKLPASSFTHLTTLRNLNLMGNGIVTIQSGEFSHMRVIESLDLSKNHIQTIHGTAFSSMDLLKKLDFSSNFVQMLPLGLFSKMTVLEKLNISNNFITSLKDQHFVQTENLRILDITNNSLTKLDNTFDHLKMVEKLYVGHNYINSLGTEAFRKMEAVEEISFSHNGIQVLDPTTFQNISSLLRINMDSNNIAELNKYTFRNLSNLEEINLSKNQISSVKASAFSGLPDLRILHLQDNAITHVSENAFDGLLSLKLLNLSHNGIQDVPKIALSRLPTLDVLDISKNYLLEILNRAFDGLQWLTVLLINDNDLCLLSDKAFEGPKNLKVLMLQNNQLKSLHLDALRTPIQSLSLLDMSGNPFECDCQMVWLREYIAQEKQRRMARLQNILTQFDLNKLPESPPETILSAFASPLRQEPVCAGPKKYEGMPITSVPPEAFLCSNINEIETGKSRCLPRYLNQLLEQAEKNGTKFPPEVQRVLHSLKSQSQDEISSISRGDLMNYLNPYFNQNLRADPILIENGSPKKAIVEKIELVNSISNAQKDFVTGDTPTIYAGSPSKSKTKQKIQTPKDQGGLFGFKLPNLPDIFGSFTNKLPNLGLNMKLGGLPFGRKDGPYHSQLVGNPNTSSAPSWVEISKDNAKRQTDLSSPSISMTPKPQSSLSEWMKNYYTDNKEVLDMSLLRPFSQANSQIMPSLPPSTETLGPGPESGTPFLPALGDVQHLTTQRSVALGPSTRNSKVFSINDDDLRGILPGKDSMTLQWDWMQDSRNKPPNVFQYPDPFIVIENPQLKTDDFPNIKTSVHPAALPNQPDESTTRPFIQDPKDIVTNAWVNDSGLVVEDETTRPISKSTAELFSILDNNLSVISEETIRVPDETQKIDLGGSIYEDKIAINLNPALAEVILESSSEKTNSTYPDDTLGDHVDENLKKPRHRNETNLLPPKKKYISPSRTVGRNVGISKVQKVQIETMPGPEIPDLVLDNEGKASALAHPNNEKLRDSEDWYFRSYYKEYDPEGPIGGNGPPPISISNNAVQISFCKLFMFLWWTLL